MTFKEQDKGLYTDKVLCDKISSHVLFGTDTTRNWSQACLQSESMLVQNFMLKRSRYVPLVGDVTMQGVLYGNGVAEGSFARNGLQKGIEQRAKFCKNVTLKCINLEKTNVMVFDKSRGF